MLAGDASGLRQFIERYANNYNGDYLEIPDEISVEYDTTTYSLIRNRENRMLMFNNLKGYRRFRLLSNMLGSERRVMFSAGCSSMEEFNRRFSAALGSSPEGYPIIESASPPFTKNIQSGASVNIFGLPVPAHYPSDGGRTGHPRYITGGIVAVREHDDPEVINLSFTRIQPISKNRYAFDSGSHGHLWNHLRVAREKGLDADLTVLIGTHPLYYLLAASFTDGEYEKAAAFMDVHLSKGIVNDILVPSDTEIVIEARFIPDGDYQEGPFAEYTGYMGQDSTRYLAEVRSIATREDAIYYDIQPSNSREHVNTFSLPRSAKVSDSLRQIMPRGTDFSVHWPDSGGRFLSFAWVDPPELNVARQLGISIMALDPLWAKLMFINRGKGKLDFTAAIARLLNTEDKIRDCVTKFPEMFVISSDFTAEKEGTVCKLLFVTHAADGPAHSEMKNGELVVEGKYGRAVISHGISEGQRVNIVVGPDIDVSDPDQVSWAISTRVNPARDVKIMDNSIVILANGRTPEVPEPDRDSVKRISKMFPAKD